MCHLVDPEACREKAKVSIWRRQHGTSCNTTSQTEEEGCDEDGLRRPRSVSNQSPFLLSAHTGYLSPALLHARFLLFVSYSFSFPFLFPFSSFFFFSSFLPSILPSIHRPPPRLLSLVCLSVLFSCVVVGKGEGGA